MAARGIIFAFALVALVAAEQDDLELRRKVHANVLGLGVFCDRMCKAVNAYPNCACPAPSEAELNAAAAAAGIPPCIFKHCPKDGAGVCPNLQFMTCVEASYKPSLAQLKQLPALPELQKRLVALQTAVAVYNPSSSELEARRKIQSHVLALGVFCDRMCKAVNAYPNCACPAPTEAELNAAAAAAGIPPCIFKHCPKDGKGVCPNLQFMTCVEASYKPSLAQLSQLAPIPQLQKRLAAVQAAVTVYSSSSTDLENRRKLQARVLGLGVFCDRMCKAVNAYPNCACPPPSEAELNAAAAAAGIPPCIFKHCPKDGSGICPNLQFMTCVEASYKPGLMQLNKLPSVPVLQKQLAMVQAAVEVYNPSNEELEARRRIQSHVLALGVFCDRMCKAVNAYPNCACPPPSEAELNAAAAAAGIPPCIFKHCPKDGKGVCPNLQFMSCVEAAYKPSLAQLRQLSPVPELQKKLGMVQAAITIESARAEGQSNSTVSKSLRIAKH